MSNIKCILLDIDYTLTDNNGNISDYTKSVLQQAREDGIYVILCTGRPNIYAIQKSKEGQTVSFDVEQGPKGLNATNITKEE